MTNLKVTERACSHIKITEKLPSGYLTATVIFIQNCRAMLKSGFPRACHLEATTGNGGGRGEGGGGGRRGEEGGGGGGRGGRQGAEGGP